MSHSQYSYKDYSFSHSENLPSATTFHRHMHNSFELLYFVKGDANYVIEGSVYNLCPGDLIAISPRKFHYLDPLSDACYERFVIYIPLDDLPQKMADTLSDFGEIHRLGGGTPVDLFFEDWKAREKDLSHDRIAEYLYYSLMSMLIYMERLSSDATEVPAITKSPMLDSMLRYIDGHPTENITAEMLATKFYVSQSWITHSFKRELGISLMSYVHKKRILYAEALIIGGASPTEAATICNYENYSTFYRQYVKILGSTPVKTGKMK